MREEIRATIEGICYNPNPLDNCVVKGEVTKAILALFADKVRWLEVDINPYGEAIHFGVKVGLAAFRSKLLKELGVEA